MRHARRTAGRGRRAAPRPAPPRRGRRCARRRARPPSWSTAHERAPVVEVADAEHVVACRASRPWSRGARRSRGGRGRARSSRARFDSRCVRLSYIASGSEPGRSVRPHPSRNSVSPATSLSSTTKHWLPGVWPGVCISVIGICPDGHHVAAVVEGEIGVGQAGAALHPFCFRSLHVHRDRAALEREQLAQALDRVAHDVAAAVVGVVVRREHAAQAEAVGGEDVEQLVRRRRRGPPRWRRPSHGHPRGTRS